MQEKPRVIGVSGGKGGTGKSFVATNLAIALADKTGARVLLVDADVDNPNDAILLGTSLENAKGTVTCFFPKINPDMCSGCGTCADNCRFHALFQMKGKTPQLLEPLCKSCELCMRICPEEAISARQEDIGEWFFQKVGSIDLLSGRLQPGSAKTTFVIMEINQIARELVNNSWESHDGYRFIIVDTSPGAHCDVEHALEDVDHVICVTEPTPLGRHDLGRILELCSFMGKPASIVINRSDMAEYQDGIESIARERASEVISRIPLSRDVMETYARGIPIMLVKDELKQDHPVIAAFLELVEKIEGD